MPLITSSREHLHGGEFIIVELGPLSRNSAQVAEGQVLDAGEVVEFNDDAQLIAFTGEGACAGILIYPVDTREGIQAAAYIARRAKVRLEGLTYPEGLAATTAGALAALTIEVRSTGLISDTGGGGGGDWWDADSKIDIDLVNNRAWTLADGEVAIDTLLGSDPNTENAWSETAYDVGNLTADGYVSANAIALIGTARDLFLAGATSRFVTKIISATPGGALEVILVSADGNDAIEIDLDVQFTGGGYHVVPLHGYSWNGSVDIATSNEGNAGLGGVNIEALTVTNTRLEGALNGGTAVADTMDDTDRPAANPLVAVVVQVVGESALQSIKIYDPLPSTAGLSELTAG